MTKNVTCASETAAKIRMRFALRLGNCRLDHYRA